MIGCVLHDSAPVGKKIARLLDTFPELTSMARGRVFFLGMINEWADYFRNSKDRTEILCTVRNFIKYSFRLREGIYIESGKPILDDDNYSREKLTTLFDKWRK
jgi:hypothetical protein